jgi:hypothetical protein
LANPLKAIPGGGGGGLGNRLAFGVGGTATASAAVASRRSNLWKQVTMSTFVTLFMSVRARLFNVFYLTESDKSTILKRKYLSM